MQELITEVLVLPDGMEPDDDEMRHFAVTVRWRGARGETGRGGYAVMHGNRHYSRAGNWRSDPEPFVQRHYRWANLEDALTVARSIVNTITVYKMTWSQWQERQASKRDATS